MIKYALHCAACDDTFEAWFASSDAYEKLRAGALVECPTCSSTSVDKQIMAPAIRSSKKGTANASPQMVQRLAKAARDHIAKNCDYVGDDFASQARAMHYGERAERAIWGETTPDESEALRNEGIPATPLPAPFAPTPPKPKSDLN